MTLEQLYYFTEIVNNRSINSAALACHMTYQAMSKSLKNLERELNFQLVERDYLGISLTDKGKLFYDDALKILKMSENWKTLSEYDHDKKRELFIYATPFFCNTVLEPLQESPNFSNYVLACFPCYAEVILQLLSNSKNLKKTVGLTCYYPGLPDVISFAKDNGYIAEWIHSAKFLAYVNTACLDEKESLQIETLKKMRPIIVGSSQSIKGLFPYSELWENHIPTNSLENAFSILRNNCNTFYLGGLSYKDSLESLYPDIKGVEIDALNAQLDYYMIYSETLPLQDKIILDYIKDYFTKPLENLQKLQFLM